MNRISSFATLLVVVAAAPAVQAQERAAMLETGAVGQGAESVGRAFDRLARTRFERLAPMPLDAAPPLPLEDLQLAVGCVGESVECLRAVAERVGVEVMVVPTVEHSGGTYVASFLLFDGGEDETRRVTRRVETESELFDRVDPMLRELFDLPPPEVDDAPSDLSSGETAGDSGSIIEPGGTPSDRSPGFPVGPAIVAGVSALAIAGGVIAGALSQDAEAAYAEADTSTRAGVDEAHARLGEAETTATVANVLFAVGGAAMVGALVWWLVGSDSPFGASASPEGVAVSFETHWGGDS